MTTDAEGSVGSFRGTARLFPLPNLVLFPHVVQPLHIFEPRYRQLTEDALADDRLVAMALLRPGWEDAYHQSPAIFPVICLCTISAEERLPDGRFNLLVQGLRRAQVVEELPTDRLYRVARLRLLDDVPAAMAQAQQLRAELAHRLVVWSAAADEAVAKLRRLLDGELPLGVLADLFAFALPLDMSAKQAILQECIIERRVGQLLAHLETHAPRAATKFPPDFSEN